MFRGTRKGLFWLLDKPEHMVDGTLNIRDRGRLELTTQGLLDLIDDGDTLRTIRGATANGYVTLVEARTSGIKHQFNRYLTESQETWFCQYAFQGESGGGDRLDEEIVSAEVEIQSLPDWAYEGRNLRLDWGNDTLSWSVEQPGPSGKWSLGEVTIRHAVYPSRSGRAGHHRTVEVMTKTSFAVNFDQPRSLAEVLDTVSSLQALVSVAVGEAAAIERVTLTVSTGQPNQRLLLHYDPVLWPLDPAPKDSELFSMSELGGIEGVGRWLDFLRGQTVLKNGFLADRYRSPAFITDRTLHLLIACEAYQRHVGNRVGDEMRLPEVLPALDPVGRGFLDWIGDWEVWQNSIAKIRNNEAAHLQSYGRAMEDAEPIATVNEQLYAFLVIRILIQCGLSEELIERVVSRLRSEAVMRVW